MPRDQRQHLFALYLEAYNGEQRQQWIVLPPIPITFNGERGHTAHERALVYVRNQPNAKARTQWSSTVASISDPTYKRAMKSHIETYASIGWTFSDPVHVPLSLSDATQFWETRTTPWPVINRVKKIYEKRGEKLR